jgi:UDP-galactopyranose mutase
MNLDEYSYVFSGSGLLGIVVAEQIAQCLYDPAIVMERRNHFGGNCCSENEALTQIEYHKCDIHNFHTSDQKIWNYINQFNSFNTYRHQILASYNNKKYQLPINVESIKRLLNVNLNPYEVDSFMLTCKKYLNRELTNFKKKPFLYWASNCMKPLLTVIP